MNLLKFDHFTIDPERRRLLRDGEPVPLTPKTFDTLLTLVRERGRVVEKSELMQLLWPDTAVEENNLSQQISAARKALGERSDEGRYIRTVPGRGYRFVAEVVVTPSVSEGPGGAGGATPVRPGPSVTLGVTDTSSVSPHAATGWQLRQGRNPDSSASSASRKGTRFFSWIRRASRQVGKQKMRVVREPM